MNKLISAAIVSWEIGKPIYFPKGGPSTSSEILFGGGVECIYIRGSRWSKRKLKRHFMVNLLGMDHPTMLLHNFGSVWCKWYLDPGGKQLKLVFLHDTSIHIVTKCSITANQRGECFVKLVRVRNWQIIRSVESCEVMKYVIDLEVSVNWHPLRYIC